MEVNGITPWNNLITTFDDPNGSIDMRTIQEIVDIFILKR